MRWLELWSYLQMSRWLVPPSYGLDCGLYRPSWYVPYPWEEPVEEIRLVVTQQVAVPDEPAPVVALGALIAADVLDDDMAARLCQSTAAQQSSERLQLLRALADHMGRTPDRYPRARQALKDLLTKDLTKALGEPKQAPSPKKAPSPPQEAPAVPKEPPAPPVQEGAAAAAAARWLAPKIEERKGNEE